MADIKILDLTTATEITETTDYIPVVDTSDTAQDSTGTTKKATVRKLLGDRVLPDTIVGTTETQTLTNKTLSTGSVIDANVNVVEVLKKVYPVGCIYTSTVSTNPNTLFGFGTWSAFGAGRTLVGIDSGDTDFDTVEETGGAKTHTLSNAELPALSGTVKMHGGSTGSALWSPTGIFSTSNVVTGKYKGWGTEVNDAHSLSSLNISIGSGSAHNNLQPYIVVYFWKRTA